MPDGLRWLHSAVTTCQLPPLITWLRPVYRDTWFHFKQYPGVAGHVALTIDDGLCAEAKQGNSLAAEVLELLREHEARATFFLVLGHVRGLDHELRRLVAEGHELANHGVQDRSMAQLSEEDFERELATMNNALREFLPEGQRLRWFRAPQGKYSGAMQRVLERQGMNHLLADCYCDDWAIEDAAWIASTLLQQAQEGSVIIIHMPSRQKWPWLLEALTLLLRGLRERGLRPVTVTRLAQLASATIKPGIPRDRE